MENSGFGVGQGVSDPLNRVGAVNPFTFSVLFQADAGKGCDKILANPHIP